MRFWFGAMAVALTALAVGQPKFSHPDRIRYDGHCFTIDGKDLVVYSGAFHYFRCPKELWRERFRKIKEAGFNAIETYVAWNWSEREKPRGLDDYSHVKLDDFDQFLKMAEDEFGLYTIVRPGPYICAEWATGGYPNWLTAFEPAHLKRPLWFRSDDPVFEQWSHHWFKAVAKVVNKHQLTHRPVGSHGVILWQVENEYGEDRPGDDTKRNYVKDLMECSWKNGIDVPIFTCWTDATRHPKGDAVLSQAFDNPNEYPRWNIEDAVNALGDQHEAEPWAPKMITEFQGGWFGQVGGLAAPEQDGIDDRQINALTLWCLGNGMTGLNYYMLFGGTNFADWAADDITTSYDYNCPIREWGGVDTKYRAVKAVGKMLQAYGPDLARADMVPGSLTTDGDLHKVARKGQSGATYVFYWNKSRTSPADIDPGNGKNLELPPFGANVYRYKSSPADGSWIVVPDKPVTPAPTATLRLKATEVADLTPIGWRGAPTEPTTTRLGVYDSRFVMYRSTPPTGKALWLRSGGSELIPATAPSGEGARQGRVWVGDGKEKQFLLYNPGWPNGGQGMELQHGIIDARLFEKAPVADAISGWKMTMLTDQKDRSLVATDIDTSSWTEGVHNDLFLPHTTGVVRAGVTLVNDPAADTVLTCGGVDDEGWFYVNGHLVGEVHTWDEPVTLKVGQYLHKGHNDIAIVIQNNDGEGGLTGAVALEQPLPQNTLAHFDWTDRFKEGQGVMWGLDTTTPLAIYEHPKIETPRPAGSARLVKSTLKFDKLDTSRAWEIVLEAGGDGFLTLNGHALGRYWEVGPQRAFFLPGCWLKDHNELELTVAPGRFGDRVKAAELRTLPWEQ